MVLSTYPKNESRLATGSTFQLIKLTMTLNGEQMTFQTACHNQQNDVNQIL